MSERYFLYRLDSVPDPTFPRYQEIAGGDVRRAISDASEHLVRGVAEMAAGTLSLVIRFVFDPTPEGDHPQRRLTMFLGGWAEDDRSLTRLRTLIQGGTLCQYYGSMQEADEDGMRPDLWRAACFVYRRDGLIEAQKRFNPLWFRRYYWCSPFERQKDTDGIALDRLLSRCAEHVTIDLAVAPTTTFDESMALARYISRLRDMNRAYGQEGIEPTVDLLASRDQYRPNPITVSPIRQRDMVADNVCRQQERIQEGMSEPHLRFHLLVMAQSEAVAQSLASELAQGGFKDGTYQTALVTERAGLDRIASRLRDLRVSDLTVSPQLVQNSVPSGFPSLSRLPHVAPVEQLLGVMRLPVASFSSTFCIRKNTDPPLNVPADLVLLGYDSAFCGHTGSLVGTSVPRGVTVRAMCKHMLTCGMPGYGKTSSNMLALLATHILGIPFLVIECARTEYRALKMPGNYRNGYARDLADRLEVYTLGNEDVSPERFNPFQIAPGLSVDQQIDWLVSFFQSAMPTEAPMPDLFRQAMTRIYRARPDGMGPPVMGDVLCAVGCVLAEKGYSPEVHQNLRGALDTRLATLERGTVGRIFQCGFSVPSIEHLLQTPTILELNRLGEEQACLFVMSLLGTIEKTVRAAPPSHGHGLRLLVLIEEAHRVLGAKTGTTPSDKHADPKPFVSTLIVRMLAELRALGVGLIISDQFASAIAPEVIKATTTKLAFRQAGEDDMRALGASMGWRSADFEDAVRLQQREAFLFTEESYGPRKIQIADLATVFTPLWPADAELRGRIQQEDWFREARVSRRLQEAAHLKTALDAWAHSVSQARTRLERIRQSAQPPARALDGAGSLQKELRRIKAAVLTETRRFTEGPLQQYSGDTGTSDDTDDPAHSQMQTLAAEYRDVAGLANEVVHVVDRMIATD